MKVGALAYALLSVGMAVETVRMIRHDGQWADVGSDLPQLRLESPEC